MSNSDDVYLIKGTTEKVNAYQWMGDTQKEGIPGWLDRLCLSISRINNNQLSLSFAAGAQQFAFKNSMLMHLTDWVVLGDRTDMLRLYSDGKFMEYHTPIKEQGSNQSKVVGVFEEYAADVLALASDNIPDLDQSYPYGPGRSVAELLHSTIGMSTEANEILTNVKAFLFYNRPLDCSNVKEELGDLFWFAALCMRYFGWTLEEVLEANKRKLHKRYPQGYTDGSANKRDLEAESKAMSKEAWVDPSDRNSTASDNAMGVGND
jgi:NTP pyrophosphatase (non-canonical NTP hydrolase)